MSAYKYLFGPVPSRRFGRSLGVDLVPAKTCTADCVFCQLGHGAATTLERREYVPTQDVLAELRDWFSRNIETDYVTLAGSGEPTLHGRFGDILSFIRANSEHRTALLTNGTLFVRPEVRAAACRAHVVKVPLSAWDETSFRLINHPHVELRLDRLLDSYKEFRREFTGEMWLEVFLVPGHNTATEQVARIAALARTFSPDRVHLNTAVRPGADPLIVPLPRMRMEALADLFTPRADVAAEFPAGAQVRSPSDETAILAVILRHPSTSEQLADSLGIPLPDIARFIRKLTADGRIERTQREGKIYYHGPRPA